MEGSGYRGTEAGQVKVEVKVGGLGDMRTDGINVESGVLCSCDGGGE